MNTIICWLQNVSNWLESHNGAITAISTVLIAIFTIALAVSTKRLWKSTEKSISFIEKEFIATHRPKIIVRSFQILDQDIPIGKQIEFHFVAQNIGDTEAKIIEIRDGTFIQPANNTIIPGNLRFPHRENLLPDLTLKSGENIWVAGNGGSKPEDNELMEIYAGDLALYCMGIIVYVDGIGTRRETGFCRRYWPREGRWDIIECEYEYAY